MNLTTNFRLLICYCTFFIIFFLWFCCCCCSVFLSSKINISPSFFSIITRMRICLYNFFSFVRQSICNEIRQKNNEESLSFCMYVWSLIFDLHSQQFNICLMECSCIPDVYAFHFRFNAQYSLSRRNILNIFIEIL